MMAGVALQEEQGVIESLDRNTAYEISLIIFE
jgi:hypothetical protein